MKATVQNFCTALALSLCAFSSAYAGGEDLISNLQDEAVVKTSISSPCRNAGTSAKALAAGARCTVRVTVSEPNEETVYWLEYRRANSNSSGRWQRYKATHVYDLQAANNESLSFAPTLSREYRIAVSTGGRSDYAEINSDAFRVFVK